MINKCNKDAALYWLFLGSNGGNWDKMGANDGKQLILSFNSSHVTKSQGIANFGQL